MRKQSLFSKERLVYWPDEFSEVVDLLTGRDREGRTVGNPLYAFNTGAIILAASLGARGKRKRDVGASRKEINTTTFVAHHLEPYIFLVPLLGDPSLGTDFLRPENEEQVIREFERYAAGGLEILSGEMDASAGKSADVIVQGFMLPAAIRKLSTELPDLI